jgi:hypothetical protein
MYSWFNKHLKLGLAEPVVEEHWQPLTQEEGAVWNDEHPQPEGGPEYERSLCKWLADQSDRQMERLAPRDADSLTRYREVIGGAFDTILGRRLGQIGKVELVGAESTEHGTYLLVKQLLRVIDSGAELPVISLVPTEADGKGPVTIWITGRGKAGMFADDGQPRAAVQRLLKQGVTVVGADLLHQGEFLAAGESFDRTPVVSNPREYAGYTFGYNHTVFAQRVHDVLALISAVRKGEQGTRTVHLVGLAGAGPVAAAARAQAAGAVRKTAVDTGGFRFVRLNSYRDPEFLPGAVKYGDLPALLALSAPQPLWLAGEGGKTPKLVAAAYTAVGKPQAVVSSDRRDEEAVLAAAAWLLVD